MTEDAAIQIDFDSAEFVHVTHTMEFFLHPHSGTCPTGSLELIPQYRARTSPTKLDYRVTSLRYHRHTVLGIPVVRCPSLPPNHSAKLLAISHLVANTV